MRIMLDALRIAYHRLNKVRTLEGALKQLIAPSRINRVLEEVTRPCDLLEHVADSEDLELYVLLDEVADRLDMVSVQDLCLPSSILIKKSGYDAAFLRSIPALPQPSRTAVAGWAMIVSDPAVISMEEYQARGVQVLLAVSRDVEQVWQEYEKLSVRHQSGEISVGQVFAIMEQLAKDAALCGAREVFVGHPDSSHYEFLVGEDRYSGNIHPGVYDVLLKQFKQGMQFKQESRSAEFDELTFALTKNFNNPVVYLNWSNKKEDGSIPNNERSGDGDFEENGWGRDENPDQEKDDERLSGIRGFEGSASTVVNQEGEEKRGENVKRLVMLIDDDRRFVGILRRILEQRGFQVSCHEDGEAALASLDREEVRPDVIICDVHMPKMDGSVFLRKLGEKTALIPVLMVTSDEDELLEVELVELGAAAFVHKREDVRVLLAWCKNLATKGGGVRDNEKAIVNA